MPAPKKRPSKKAKAARKAIEGSKLLAAKNEANVASHDPGKTSDVTPRTNTLAMKPRPDKKRG